MEMEQGQQGLAEYLPPPPSLQRHTRTRVKETKSGAMRHKDWHRRPKKIKSLAAMEKAERRPAYQVNSPEDLGVSSTTL